MSSNTVRGIVTFMFISFALSPLATVASPYPGHFRAVDMVSNLSTIVSNVPAVCRIVPLGVFFLVNCGSAVVIALLVVGIDFLFGDVNLTFDFTVHGLLLIISVTGRKLKHHIRLHFLLISWSLPGSLIASQTSPHGWRHITPAEILKNWTAGSSS